MSKRAAGTAAFLAVVGKLLAVPALEPQRLLEQLDEILPGTWVADFIGVSTETVLGSQTSEGG